jgi:hypothetical protein
MEDKESGSLSRKPALDLLVELHRGQVTGSLKLERAPLQKAVYFRDGQILFAASNDPKDQLASILVEEGKLGPDQMQVAQARVSPGNPLAKVLTELGYISQRELAEAARIKVEKILTDLYSWKEGTYQFATKSLPKGAIDLELSTSRLLFASIRRVQDRDWVLHQLGSLDSVLTPTGELDNFIAEAHAEPLATEVLRLADGVKTVKQIGSLSTLGEFEVCKVLTAGLVAGCLSKDGSTLSSSDDAFAYAGDAFSAPSPSPSFVETVGVPVSSSSEEPMSYDTIFQAASKQPDPPEENDRTVFEPAPPRPSSRSDPFLSPPEPETRGRRGAPDLVIDEPEPDVGDEPHYGRVPPRSKKRGGGGGRARGSGGGLMKILGAVALAGLAGASVYYFVWPLVAGGSGGGSGTKTTPPATVTSAPPSATTSPPTDPRAAASTSTPSPAVTDPVATTTAPVPSPTSVAPQPAPAQPRPAATTSAPRATTSAPLSGAAKPPTSSATPSAGTGSNGHALLRSGNLPAAAQAFQQELLRTSADKFTIAVGLYCNEENVARMIEGAGGSSDVYVLPTLVDGRSCYRVVWGLFDSRDAAERSMGALPGSIRVGDAAPVALSRFLR